MSEKCQMDTWLTPEMHSCNWMFGLHFMDAWQFPLDAESPPWTHSSLLITRQHTFGHRTTFWMTKQLPLDTQPTSWTHGHPYGRKAAHLCPSSLEHPTNLMDDEVPSLIDEVSFLLSTFSSSLAQGDVLSS